jgi:hypothetical protein
VRNSDNNNKNNHNNTTNNKAADKILKYKGIATEIQCMWDVKTKVCQ